MDGWLVVDKSHVGNFMLLGNIKEQGDLIVMQYLFTVCSSKYVSNKVVQVSRK